MIDGRLWGVEDELRSRKKKSGGHNFFSGTTGPAHSRVGGRGVRGRTWKVIAGQVRYLRGIRTKLTSPPGLQPLSLLLSPRGRISLEQPEDVVAVIDTRHGDLAIVASWVFFSPLSCPLLMP